ncbi:MAG: hypothetical protein J1F07_05800 [Muribaculaceae bacterium]|nr:hypothetical protein [Muribaculaceae bacterium]
MRNFTAKALLSLACLGSFALAQAQIEYAEHKGVPAGDNFKEIYRDTITYQGPTTVLVETQIQDNSPVVLENNFKKNWFVFATFGYHTLLTEQSKLGNFAYTLSPDVSIGVGKWFTPGVGAKIEFERSSSRGFTRNPNSIYGDGYPVYNPDGSFAYQRMKTNWWDLSISGILNLSRLIRGYEGVDNKKLMNQFMLALGVGMVHHMGFGKVEYSDNELSFHAELQYSRFFTPAKAWSLDFKARGLFYQTNHDLQSSGMGAHNGSKVDVNLGIAIGATYYLGGKRYRGWAKTPTTIYQTDYRERDVLVIREREGAAPTHGVAEQGTMTFYVFYPNNYSGRNDAPVIADADVNTIDYLAGGLYTQKKYADTDAAAARLEAGRSLNGLATEDIPTELAENLTFGLDVPRGYEMSNTTPLSLSLAPADMEAFEEKEGFFYAPIYDGRHTWQYRIDDATQGQTLLSDANYAESTSFGLNAHSGLDILRENFEVGNDELVSFADVYAAVNGNEGYISQFTDPATVARIKDILNNGTITLIMTEGMATSQDNYTGANANQVGIERNSALSENRAESVLKWLQQNPNLQGVLTESYITGGNNSINTVTDKSTRGLDAKLNRGVKVKIHYVK